MVKLKTVRLYVTPSDIKNGVVGRTSSCPIARAVKRKVDSKLLVMVGRIKLTLCDGGYKTVYEAEFPPIAKSFIDDFDDNCSTNKRLNFRLDLPVSLLREGKV